MDISCTNCNSVHWKWLRKYVWKCLYCGQEVEMMVIKLPDKDQMEIDTSSLANCPFCKNKPKYHHIKPENYSPRHYFVISCVVCPEVKQISTVSKNDAIRLWNRLWEKVKLEE